MTDAPSDGTEEQAFVDDANAFPANDIPSIQVILQMRIYDVLMAIYTSIDKEGASRLYDLHKSGKILGTLPYLDLSPEDIASLEG